jgi:hypothetical protein
MVSVTEPEVISAAEGVYTALTSVALLKVPVPEVVQVEDVAAPLRVPAKVYVLPEQIVASLPALVIAPGLIVSTIASLTAGQIPGGLSVVRVNVTVPDVISAADGV